MFGIHFDHHTLSIARDGQLLASEPLAVETGAQEPRAGTAALATARGRPDEVSMTHWRELGRSELAPRHVARELLAHLKSLGVVERVEAVVAVPADLEPAALASLRGALHAAGVDAREFVDASVLTAAAVTERNHFVLLESGWKSATATRVVGGAECVVEEAFVSERANLLEVYDLWLAAVSAAMVKNTRFDPLLTLETEQRMFAALPQVAARAATEGRAEAALEEGGSRFAVEVDAQLFADAAQAFYRELARLARSARIAGQPATLVLPAESRRWPGFLPRLMENEQDGVHGRPIIWGGAGPSCRPTGTPPLARIRSGGIAFAARTPVVSSPLSRRERDRVRGHFGKIVGPSPNLSRGRGGEHNRSCNTIRFHARGKIGRWRRKTRHPGWRRRPARRSPRGCAGFPRRSSRSPSRRTGF